MEYPNTVDVFRKIARNVHEVKTNALGIITYYIITDKQMLWLMNTYGKETSVNDYHMYGITVTDDDGLMYGFSYKDKKYNVPHYIPNQASYGCKYIITIAQTK